MSYQFAGPPEQPLQSGWLMQLKLTVSESWRLEVGDQHVNRAEGESPGSQAPVPSDDSLDDTLYWLPSLPISLHFPPPLLVLLASPPQ